jgi:hypothetical protein
VAAVIRDAPVAAVVEDIAAAQAKAGQGVVDHEVASFPDGDGYVPA